VKKNKKNLNPPHMAIPLHISGQTPANHTTKESAERAFSNTQSNRLKLNENNIIKKNERI
jgi:hypothetical protein